MYYVDDAPDEFYVLSNRKEKKNFALYKTSPNKTCDSNWILFVDHKKNELIEDFLSFKDFIILETRKNGLSHLVKIDKKNKSHIFVKEFPLL